MWSWLLRGLRGRGAKSPGAEVGRLAGSGSPAGEMVFGSEARPPMKLVVGLGNPGKKYRDSRHNVGFMIADEVARRHGGGKPRENFQGLVVDVAMGGERVTILWPHTFMNKSGASVAQARTFYKLEPGDLLIICDDLDLPEGRLRFRAKGSSGGQRGVRDVISALGTDAVARLRVGIGRPPDGWDPADYVLGTFSKKEREIIDPAMQRAADAVADWVGKGIDYCMNQYNSGTP